MAKRWGAVVVTEGSYHAVATPARKDLTYCLNMRIEGGAAVARQAGPRAAAPVQRSLAQPDQPGLGERRQVFRHDRITAPGDVFQPLEFGILGV